MDKRYFELATKIAKNNKQASKSYAFGVIAIREDGLIVKSSNVMTQRPCKEAHAEYRVLTKAGYGATLYVVRLTREHGWGMARPCPACETFARNRGVQKIYYSIAPSEYGCWNMSLDFEKKREIKNQF